MVRQNYKAIFLTICGLIFCGFSFFPASQAPASESVRPAQVKTYGWGYYMRGVQRKVKSNLVINGISDTQRATITFNIDKSGKVSEIKLVKSSGNTAFDTQTLKAIEKSSPFTPLPSWYKGEGICINFYAGKLIQGSSIKSEY